MSKIKIIVCSVTLSVLSLVFLLRSSSIANQSPTSNVLFMGLVSIHTKTFGIDNIFKTYIQTNDWQKTIDEIQKFTSINARGDNVLLDAFDTIATNNNRLINSIKIGYSTLFAPGRLIQENVGLAYDLVYQFEDIQDTMQKVQNTLSEKQFYFSSKKEVQELLIKTALFIETTAQKALKDLYKNLF